MSPRTALDNKPEAVRERHQRIVAFWLQGKGLAEIARRIGYTDHTTPWHHVNGRCTCESGNGSGTRLLPEGEDGMG